MERTNRISLWLKIPYTIMVLTIIPIYWYKYGPSNFLWFSDIALISTAFALWTENKLIVSMMAISVAPIDLVWSLDFMAGGPFVTQYMFDSATPLYLRALSLFHVPLPFVIVYCVYKLGYTSRALPMQIALIISVLLFTYYFAPVQANINWVHGMGAEPQSLLHPLLYLFLLMSVMILIALPMHFLMKKWFEGKRIPAEDLEPEAEV